MTSWRIKGPEQYPFQQGAESLGFSGYAPDILGSAGKAWLYVMRVLTIPVDPVLVVARGTGELSSTGTLHPRSLENRKRRAMS
jgi:hypothetical protein